MWERAAQQLCSNYLSLKLCGSWHRTAWTLLRGSGGEERISPRKLARIQAQALAPTLSGLFRHHWHQFRPCQHLGNACAAGNSGGREKLPKERI